MGLFLSILSIYLTYDVALGVLSQLAGDLIVCAYDHACLAPRPNPAILQLRLFLPCRVIMYPP